MLTIKQVLKKLKDVRLPFDEHQQLSSLVRELGLLGAIEYLKPLKVVLSIQNRDQVMADRHRAILEDLAKIKVFW